MSDESCFTTDRVARREGKDLFISCGRLKTEKHSVRVGLSCSGFSFYEHFNRKFLMHAFFIFRTVRSVSAARYKSGTRNLGPGTGPP